MKKIFLVLIWKSAYRSNENFFSRTHSFGCVDQTCSGGGYREVQDRLLIPLRVTVLIWWTDVPRGGPSVGAGGRDAADGASQRIVFFRWNWFENDRETKHFIFIWCPYRNHSIPSKKLLQTVIIAHFFSPIDSELFKILRTIDTQAHIMSNNTTTRPPTPVL